MDTYVFITEDLRVKAGHVLEIENHRIINIHPYPRINHQELALAGVLTKETEETMSKAQPVHQKTSAVRTPRKNREQEILDVMKPGRRYTAADITRINEYKNHHLATKWLNMLAHKGFVEHPSIGVFVRKNVPPS